MSNGHGNPPKPTQFKKGQSGNPKGRPRQPVTRVSEGSVFRNIAKELILFEANGVKRRMSRWEALSRQIYSMALGNNPSAARLIDQIRKQFPGNLPLGEPTIFYISEADANL